MRHRLIDLTGGQTILSGTIPGRKLLSTLIAATRSSETPTPTFLDFDRVEVATASFLREAVIGFRDYARQTIPNIYPVVPTSSRPLPRSWSSSFAPVGMRSGAASSIPTTASSAPG